MTGKRRAKDDRGSRGGEDGAGDAPRKREASMRPAPTSDTKPPRDAIRFEAKLVAPMEGKGWTFVALSKDASAKLPTRSRVAIEGTMNGFPFRTSAFPDGEGGHEFSVNATMRKGGKASVGDVARFEIRVASDDVDVDVPADLDNAVAESEVASKMWDAITPKARAEWVAWVTGAKREETRVKRVGETVRRLEDGKRRPSD